MDEHYDHASFDEESDSTEGQRSSGNSIQAKNCDSEVTSNMLVSDAEQGERDRSVKIEKLTSGNKKPSNKACVSQPCGRSFSIDDILKSPCNTSSPEASSPVSPSSPPYPSTTHGPGWPYPQYSPTGYPAWLLPSALPTMPSKCYFYVF